MKKIIFITVAVVFLLIPVSGLTQNTATPAILNPHVGQVSLNGHIEYPENPAGSLKIQDVFSSTEFACAGSGVSNYVFTDSVYWFQFAIKNTTKEKKFLVERGRRGRK